ncbi:hypothetical protein MRB53_022305 [Persea americana]|uniref:Uncharacterized protein n=1 Tax=Persea americana TaxID=3435 RepID=A0ACC2L7A5_PERAE|nr:hypothetical protein MRB53_022305 [Persea americana]
MTSPAADASNSLNPSLHPSLQSYSFQPTTSSQLLLHLFACLMSPDDQERNGDGSSTRVIYIRNDLHRPAPSCACRKDFDFLVIDSALEWEVHVDVTLMTCNGVKC